MCLRHQSNKEQETDERTEKRGGLQIDQIRPTRSRFAPKLAQMKFSLARTNPKKKIIVQDSPKLWKIQIIAKNENREK
jgi:hypothetical protein